MAPRASGVATASYSSQRAISRAAAGGGQRGEEAGKGGALVGGLVPAGLEGRRHVAEDGLAEVVDDEELEQAAEVDAERVVEGDRDQAEAPGVLGGALGAAGRGEAAAQRVLERGGGAEEGEIGVAVGGVIGGSPRPADTAGRWPFVHRVGTLALRDLRNARGKGAVDSAACRAAAVAARLAVRALGEGAHEGEDGGGGLAGADPLDDGRADDRAVGDARRSRAAACGRADAEADADRQRRSAP